MPANLTAGHASNAASGCDAAGVQGLEFPALRPFAETGRDVALPMPACGGIPLSNDMGVDISPHASTRMVKAGDMRWKNWEAAPRAH